MKATLKSIQSELEYTKRIIPSLEGLQLVWDDHSNGRFYWFDHEKHLLPPQFARIKTGKQMLEYLKTLQEYKTLVQACKA